MAIKESALAAITSITQSDLIRAVTSAGASRRITVANLAKAIIENYVGSSLAGSSQSVKAALDSLNSNKVMNRASTTLTPNILYGALSSLEFTNGVATYDMTTDLATKGFSNLGAQVFAVVATSSSEAFITYANGSNITKVLTFGARKISDNSAYSGTTTIYFIAFVY